MKKTKSQRTEIVTRKQLRAARQALARDVKSLLSYAPKDKSARGLFFLNVDMAVSSAKHLGWMAGFGEGAR